jgi:predicted adenine nucleotide alpha hydrolase (AANH) superfamily ATPase
MEYRKRLDSVREFVSQEKVDYIEEDYYGLVDFTKKTAFNVENRCYHCYNDRLEKSALVAKDKNHDCFSTSLLFSKHQNHDLLKEIGLAIAQKHQIEFYYIDFREYWDEQFLSDKRNHMYRQKYCGCIYSEWERYRGVMSCEL